MLINSISDYRAAIRSGQWAWPGGYPLYFITADGAALSFEAAKAERRYILGSIRDYAPDARNTDGWRIVAMEVNWEDADLTCDHTGELIESAY